MTKVLSKIRNLFFRILLVGFWISAASGGVAFASDSHVAGPAETLYLQLSRVGLDSTRVFHIRDASLDRGPVHLTLTDGTIAFSEDVLGRMTSAFFVGDGEILLAPPNEVERRSMSLFTGMAILEEQFSSAYFRFNDDTPADLQTGLRAADDAQAFVARWNDTARNLAPTDAMRLLMSFCEMLPTGEDASGRAPVTNDHLLHLRLQGVNLGVFDVFFDSTAGEQVEAGESRAAENGDMYYDVWTSFATTNPRQSPTAAGHSQTLPLGAESESDPFVPRRYVIHADVNPPKQISADVELDLEVHHGGSRALAFQLSRFLQVQRVEADGREVEFIHNPAIEGTQLARNGNDLVAVILPRDTTNGQKITLRFVYSGEVLADAGKGLLYVGARGTWYPNLGMEMANFDLTFRYPPEWTLVATGKVMPTASSPVDNTGPGDANSPPRQIGHWVSERPIPFAGFNLGKYVRATAHAGKVVVETYATAGVERNFPSVPPQVGTIEPLPAHPGPHEPVFVPPPSPAHNAMTVSEDTARAIDFYAQRFGPFPYSQLELTQMPGRESQGWPGLIFLSSFAFLTKDERERLHLDASHMLLEKQIPAHETAHQWWGDLVTWKTYRDQWLSEGLANYSALMMLQESNPVGFREIMEKYREDLVAKNKDGALPKDAGPVTLGTRLLSSRYPTSYEAISYGRATWLFHMLRSMLRDGATSNAGTSHGSTEEPFVRGLRKVRERYQGKPISTGELLDIFAEELPPSLRYEGKPSLDWFLEGWVNGTSLPKLSLQGTKMTQKENATIVSGTILQKDAPEDLVTSVPIYAVVAGRAHVLLGHVFADGKETQFHLTAPVNTRRILLDPNETILTSPK